jgi:membrane protease YdiL (CAAX protease family)
MKNILLFIAGVTAIAWGSNFAASRVAPGDPAIMAAGVSMGALGPIFMAFILRYLGREGWGNAGLRLNFKQSKGWYALSLLFAPAVLLVVAAIGFAAGVAQVSADSTGALRTMLTTLAAVTVPMAFLSVSEEFGWRGYLEPALWKVNRRTVSNHILVGLIWGFWHFPVLLFNPSNQMDVVEMAMVLIGCVALAIVYGQMRLSSGSVWPCVILHAVSNTVTISFAGSKLIRFSEGSTDLISFNTTSVAVTGAWVVASVLVLAFAGRNSEVLTSSTGLPQESRLP